MVIEYFEQTDIKENLERRLVFPLPKGITGPKGEDGRDGKDGKDGRIGVGGSISKVYKLVDASIAGGKSLINGGMVIQEVDKSNYNRVLQFANDDLYMNTSCEWFLKSCQPNNIIQVQDSLYNLYYYLIVKDGNNLNPECKQLESASSNLSNIFIKALALTEDSITTGPDSAEQGVVTVSVIKNKIQITNVREENNNKNKSMFYNKDTLEITYGSPAEVCIGNVCLDENDLKKVKQLSSGFQLKDKSGSLCYKRTGNIGYPSTTDFSLGDCGVADYKPENKILYFV